jgi:hypothetical protein
MKTPLDILNDALSRAEKNLRKSSVKNAEILGRIDFVCRCLSNRAGVRLLMACMLAKIERPGSDPRQPYTEIGGEQCFSGRTYDERFLTHFITVHELPCNSTTAFLTPALRNIDRPLTTDVVLVGRPPQVYSDTLKVLEDVSGGKVDARAVLVDTIRILLLLRNEKRARMEELLAGIKTGEDALPMSAEGIVNLIDQHLKCPHSSRLPVLAVSAAYKAAGKFIGEYALTLQSHNAADEQTGSLGDVEICLENDDHVVTCYEMKLKQVTIEDIDRALQKLAGKTPRVHDYIFITTDAIEQNVLDYAAGLYERTSGTEFAILDCIGFLRHYLHFFYRTRQKFLDAYQELVLSEPESSVRQPLKEAFLALRQAAESDE